MAFTTKTLLAGVLGTGVVVSSISWTGSGSVSNIERNINSLKQDALEAMADNGFLENELRRLQGYYNDTVTEANTKVTALNQAKFELENQVSNLQAQLEAKTDTTAEQAEMQAEIDRLQGELELANAQIAELEVYAQQADAEVTYEAMTETEKQELTTQPVNIEPAYLDETAAEDPSSTINSYSNLPYGVTDEALALDQQRVDIMADEEVIQGIEADFNNKDNPANLDIIGIKVLDGQLAYVISNDINPNNLPGASGMVHNLGVNDLGYQQLHFMLPQEYETTSLFYAEGAYIHMTY
jgi:hypothetical protein